MKGLALLLLGMFFVTASISLGEASWLSYERSRTKRWSDRSDEIRVCLDSMVHLRPCNFDVGSETRSKWVRSPAGFPDPLDDPAQELLELRELTKKGSSWGVTVVYRIKGCLPSRLPFDLPSCREGDLIGRIVQVQTFVPFKMFTRPNMDAANAELPPPYVFPDFEYDASLRTAEGSWYRQTKHGADVEAKKDRDGSRSESNARKLAKRRKFGDDVEAVKRMSSRRKFESGRVASNVAREGDNEMLELLRLRNDRETKLGNDAVNFYRIGRIGDGLRTDERSDERPNENSLENDVYEFPYDKAIPYDPEKLRAAKARSEFPYSR